MSYVWLSFRSCVMRVCMKKNITRIDSMCTWCIPLKDHHHHKQHGDAGKERKEEKERRKRKERTRRKGRNKRNRKREGEEPPLGVVRVSGSRVRRWSLFREGLHLHLLPPNENSDNPGSQIRRWVRLEQTKASSLHCV